MARAKSSRALARREPVTAEIAGVIGQMLLARDAGTVKAGLQRACELIEGGQAFQDTAFLSTALVAGMRSDDVKVRRWSYKLAGRLRDKTLLPDIKTALILEEGRDPENRSWAAAAYLGLATGNDRRSMMKSLDQEYFGTELELASRLFQLGEPEEFIGDLRSFEHNPLSRKWLSILCGYAPGEPRTIDRKFADLDLVRNAVTDTDPEIVEYSIWAEYKNKRGSHRKLLKPAHELLEHENVRRWVYRLLTKTEQSARANLGLLTERMHVVHEPSEVAREGLALGLADLQLKDRRIEPMDWYQSETSLRVKLALIDHLGRRVDDPSAVAFLKGIYSELDPYDLLALKIESVLRPDALRALKRQRVASILAPGLPTPAGVRKGDNYNLFVEKVEINMTDRSLNISGNNNAVSGVNIGDMIGSALHAAAQAQDQSFKQAEPQIRQFLEAVRDDQAVPEAERKQVIEAAEDAAKENEPSKVKSKLLLLKSLVKAVTSATGISNNLLTNGQHLIATLGQIVG